MKTILNTLIYACSLFVLSAFTEPAQPHFVGSYGVCATDPAQIKLCIKADQTYTYQDLSVPGKAVKVSGRWTMRGKKIHLEDSTSQYGFHSVWSFDEAGKVARSRKGLLYYRLVKVEE